MRQPIKERLKELQSQNVSRREILRMLYLEKYPIFEITEILCMGSSELQELSKKQMLFMLRCPVGHPLPKDPALHAEDAHYCIECQRWFNEATLNDEVELEIRRLREKEASKS